MPYLPDTIKADLATVMSKTPYEIEKMYGQVTINGLYTPAPTPDPTMAFYGRLRAVIESDAPGWSVGSITFNQGSMAGKVDIRCPHGQILDWAISWQELVNTPFPNELADHVGIAIVKQCRTAHANTWMWTPPSSQPMTNPSISLNYDDYVANLQMEMTKSFTMQWDTMANNILYGNGGGSSGNSVIDQLIQLVPELASATAKCPACPTAKGPVTSLIPHINDDHKWTRGQIADWLETLDVDLTVKPKKKENNDHDGRSPREKVAAAWEADF